MALGAFLRAGALASFDVSALPRSPTSGPSPLWTAVRGAGLARLRLAPAAAWPLDRGPHPGEPVGAVAPAPALGPANATPVRHGHGLRNVLLGPHRTRLHHTVGLQQYRGSVVMAILTHATWNTFYSAVDGRVEEHWFQMDLLRLMGQ